MDQTYSWRQKMRQLLIILLPILITQISLCATSFFDTMMSGHASANDLAGVAIGSNIWMPIFTGINGILIAVTPIMAQLHGAKRAGDVPFVVMQGVYLALALALVVVVGGMALLTPMLNGMGLEPEVEEIAYRFLTAISIGIAPLFVGTVLRSFMDTLGYTRVTMLITLFALPVNIMLNYMLIFGPWGFPRLGGAGAGYASAITYWCIALISFVVVCRVAPFKDYHLFGRLYGLSYRAWKEQLSLGVPIGITIFCETSIFGVVALLMTQFGTVTIAAHQAAINFASLIYMLPLSIGMTLTIVVGFEVGAKRMNDARQYGYLGLGLAVVLALVMVAGLFLFNDQVARLYTDDPAVLSLTRTFLLFAAFFQLSDAIAAPIQGVLRGYKDVTVTFVMALVSYWIIGLPVGYVLAHCFSWGAVGYWIGFITGLAIGATGLAVRLIRVQRPMR